MVVGACMAGGMHGRGTCMAGGHAWQGGMHDRGGMHGRGHVWQGVCMAGGMHGRGHAWQERWSLQWAVCILLECILVIKIVSLYFQTFLAVERFVVIRYTYKLL